MITLQTKETVNIPLKRGIKIGKVRLEITSLLFRNEYVRVEGNYHWINETGEKEILDQIMLYRPKEIIYDFETQLNALNGNNIYELLNERLVQLSLAQIDIESGENFGTVSSDWELLE